MKLHVGCGNKRIEGFVNVDIRSLPEVDVVADITDLSEFEGRGVELIYCSHVLEHIKRHEYMEVLSNWHSVLNTGGILRLAVPDIEQVFNHYQKYKNLEVLRGFLWGGQTYPENFHYCGWDFDTLSIDLYAVGFKSVRRYNWRETEHADVDDFSQCYLPHMDKENGMLMSLNIEAIK